MTVLARKAAQWTEDHAVELRHADPELPEALYNRDADNWRPLFAIAEIAGGDWPARVKAAALGQVAASEDQSIKTQLFSDIRDVFTGDRIASADLVAALVAMPERPWGELNHGKAITPNWLGRKLKPFGLKPKTIRTEDGTSKGYLLADFNETCARYLTPRFSTVTSNTLNDFNSEAENKP